MRANFKKHAIGSKQVPMIADFKTGFNVSQANMSTIVMELAIRLPRVKDTSMLRCLQVRQDLLLKTCVLVPNSPVGLLLSLT